MPKFKVFYTVTREEYLEQEIEAESHEAALAEAQRRVDTDDRSLHTDWDAGQVTSSIDIEVEAPDGCILRG